MLFIKPHAIAAPGRTTYQAKIIKPDGLPLESAAVNFQFTILDPAGSCVLYRETFAAVNMTGTAGIISVALGSGLKTFPVSSVTFENVFSNSVALLTCASGGPSTYSPLAADTRKIVMQFNDGSGWQTLPAMNINAVPYAMFASDTQKFSGLDASEFVQVSTLPTCLSSEALRYNGAGFSCVNITSNAAAGASFSISSNDVISALGYSPPSPASYTAVISSLNSISNSFTTLTATSERLGTLAFANQLDLGSASATGIISDQRLIDIPGLASGSQYAKVIVDGKGRVVSGAQLTSEDINSTLAVPTCGLNQYLSFNGVSYTCATDSGSSGTITSIVTTGALSATAGANPILSLNINSDFTVSSNALSLVTTGVVPGTYIKMTVDHKGRVVSSSALTSSDIIAALGYTPAVSGSGLSTLDLGSANATGTLGILRLPSFTGDVNSASGSNVLNLSNSGVTPGTYSKITVDSKGRVTSGTVLLSSDIISALGFTPAQSAAVSSQWITSGTSLKYSLGNVGIAVDDPQSKLSVGGVIETTTGGIKFPDGTIQTTAFVASGTGLSGANTGTWVNFSGLTSANVSGTYTRTGTSLSITLPNHNHLAGHYVSLTFNSGTATNGVFVVNSVMNTNTFTITHPVSGATSGNVTLNRRSMRGNKNVQSVTYVSPGQYYINFSNLFDSINVATVTTAANTIGNFPYTGTYLVSTAAAAVGTYVPGSGFEDFSYVSFMASDGVAGGAGSSISGVSATASTDGYLTAADWNLFNSKLSTVDLGSPSATGILSALRLPAFNGDVFSTSASSTLNVVGLRGISLSSVAPTSGQILSYNGSQWVPTSISNAVSAVASAYATIFKSSTQTFAVPGTWYDITLDGEGLKQNIAHSNAVNSARVQVLNSGLYKVTYSLNFKGGSGTGNTRLLKNGTTEIAGSFQSLVVDGNDHTAVLGTTVVVMLNAGDYLTIQGASNVTSVFLGTYDGAPTTRTTAVMTITSLEGNGAGGDVLTGGSSGYLPVWTSSSTLSNSTLFSSGSNVGIGTNNPQSALDVSGTLRVSQICDRNGNNCQIISSGWGAGSGSGTGTTWQIIASHEFTASATSYTFSGLNGNSDLEYRVIGRFVAGAAAFNYGIRLNGDAVATNYGDSFSGSSGGAASVGNYTNRGFLYFGGANSIGNLTFSESLIYAKSGQERTALTNVMSDVNGSSISSSYFIPSVWSNTSSNISSMTIVATAANGIGIGSYIELWAKRTTVVGSGSISQVTAVAPLLVSGTTSPQISLATSGSVSGQTLRFDGTSWQRAKLLYTDLVNSVAASPWPASSCSAGQAVTWNSATDSFSCTDMQILASRVPATNLASNVSGGVTGILPVTNGGTGSTSFTANRLLIGNGTSPVTSLSAGTSGSVLYSNGTGAAPVWVTLDQLTSGINNSMFSGWPDAFICSDGTNTRVVYYALSNGGITTYRAPMNNANDLFIQYNSAGAYSSHSAMTGYDCVSNAWSITQLKNLGKTFNFAKGPAGQWLASGTSTYLNSGNVGIGTASPMVPLSVMTPVPTATLHPFRAGIQASGEGTDVTGRVSARVAGSFETPLFTTYKSFGTLASPTAVTANQQIAGLVGFAYNGTDYIGGGNASISFWTTQNQTASAAGTRISFSTANSNTIGATEKMVIESNGSVGIGTSSPTTALTVSGTVRSISGGFQFPDGTIQTTAATSASAPSVRAWANFYWNGSAVVINQSYGVSSITRTGTGSYTVNLSQTMSTIYPAVALSVASSDNTTLRGISLDARSGAPISTTAIKIVIQNGLNTSYFDPTVMATISVTY